MKKYKKDGSLTKAWIKYEEYSRRFEEEKRIRAEEARWYYEHGIYPPLERLPWQQKDALIEQQKKEKLSSKLTTCVYCYRVIREGRRTYIKRWEGKMHCFIGNDAKQRKLEYEFQWNRICCGCANIEYAIGNATDACEKTLTELKREIHAQTHGNLKEHSRSSSSALSELGRSMRQTDHAE
jgi:hypothetical protein